MVPIRKFTAACLALGAGALLGALPACSNNPNRKQNETIVKTNPLDMADQDAKTIVVEKKLQKPQYPKVDKIDPKTAPYVAGKNSRIFHVRSCEYAKSLDSAVGFASAADAQKSGHIPCEFCKPLGEVGQ